MIPIVFCVDDDKVALMINKLNLQKTKFCEVILTAENGKEALDYFDNQMLLSENERVIPDLILLDLNMPVIDGWEFLEFFSEKYIELHKKVKIALLSSSVNPDDKTKADSNPFVFTFIDKALGMDNLNNLKEHAKLKDYFISQA
jgi:CheY-like chemotaxis protein